MEDEYASLTNSFQGRKSRGYGAAIPTTGASSQPKAATLTHKVTKSDSLTSLAIRYNSTVADIKRANKLWNNEGLTFRDTIDIPVFSDKTPTTTNSSSLQSVQPMDPSAIHVTLSSSAHTNGTDLSYDEFFNDFDAHASETAVETTVPSITQSPEESPVTLSSSTASVESEASNNDFFAKFDQSLSFLKKKVEDQACSSIQYADADLSTHRTHPERRDKTYEHLSQNGMNRDANFRGSRSSVRSSDDVKTTPEPVIKAKVKKKIKKLKERQDELFTL